MGGVAMSAMEYGPTTVLPEKPETRPIQVGDIKRWADRTLERIDPLKHVRELTVNGLEAVIRAILAGLLEHGEGRVFWTYDPEQAQKGRLKIMTMDNGDGMSAQQLYDFMCAFFSSITFQPGCPSRNHGIGSKVAGLARGRYGLYIRSWQDGKGHEAWLWEDEKGKIGFKPLRYKGGWVHVRPIASDHICQTEPTTGERIIEDHGTTVTVMGESLDEPTVMPVTGTPRPQRWLAANLNSILMRVPDGVVVHAISDWKAAEEVLNHKRHFAVRRIQGQQHYLDLYSVDRKMPKGLFKLLYPRKKDRPKTVPKMPHGVVKIDKPGLKAEVRWYLQDKRSKKDFGSTRGSQYFETGQRVIHVYQDEVYESFPGHGKLSDFGVFTLPPKHTAIALVVTLDDSMKVRPSDERTRLELPNGKPIPWDGLTAAFAAQFPPLLDKVLRLNADRKVEPIRALKKSRASFLYESRFVRFRLHDDGDTEVDIDSKVKGRKQGDRQPANRGVKLLFCKTCAHRPKGEKVEWAEEAFVTGARKPPCYGRAKWLAVNRACPHYKVEEIDLGDKTPPPRGEVYDKQATKKTKRKKPGKRTKQTRDWPKCEFVTVKQRPDLKEFPAIYIPATHTIVVNEDYAITRVFVQRFEKMYTKVYDKKRAGAVREKVQAVIRAHLKEFFSQYTMGNLANAVPTKVAKKYGVDPMSWVSPYGFHCAYQGQMNSVWQGVAKTLKKDMPKFIGPSSGKGVSDDAAEA
jgi:hypothetical protein